MSGAPSAGGPIYTEVKSCTDPMFAAKQTVSGSLSTVSADKGFSGLGFTSEGKSSHASSSSPASREPVYKGSAKSMTKQDSRVSKYGKGKYGPGAFDYY